jgi:hypothetical protein
MKKYIFPTILLLVTGIIFPSNSFAIPAFARKYGFSCNMCHTAFTKLNDFGQRYRDNGYQIPGEEGKEKNVFDLAPPLAMRLSTSFLNYKNEDGSVSTFYLNGLDILASGVLHKNISFLLIYTPRIDLPSASYAGPDSLNSNGMQSGALESANLVFSNVIQNALSIRVGRFEPAYHVFSSKRSYYLFQPYETYNFITPQNAYAFSENQLGIEFTGHFSSGFKYVAGVLNGNGANPDNNSNKDIYMNLMQTFGRGDGQSAGQRIGIFGYYGWQPLGLPGKVTSPQGATNGTNNKAFYRVGASGSLNWKTINLQLMYLYGQDNKAFNNVDATKNYLYTGGFVQLDYAGLLNNRMVASVMYNYLRTPSYDPTKQLNSYSALLRYYLGDWSAFNIATHLEYTYRETGKTNKTKENLFALSLDFAF